MRPTRVRIDTATLKQNLARLRAVNGSAFFCPMIKANAYGHGVRDVAPVVAQSGADAAGVALIEEAIELRRLGFKLPVLVFAPLQAGDGDAIREYKLTPVLGRFEDLERLGHHSIQVHLKFNTGMQRLGFDREQLPELHEKLKQAGSISVTGLCTHFTHGEDAANASGPTNKQFELFLEMSKGFPGVKHAHKSATLAATELKKVHPEIGARPGISIYGLPYDEGKTGAGLNPVLSWHTQLIHVHQLERGQSVSYGARWTAQQRSTIGVVPMGYADGYFRSLSNRGTMLFRGIKVPVAGTVCMDYVLLDLTKACADGVAKVGEDIVVIGKQGSAEIFAADLATVAGTIEYEVVTSIGPRVVREAV
jgi:alanine racemase